MKRVVVLGTALFALSDAANAYIITLACYKLTPLVPISHRLEVRSYIEAGPTEWPLTERYRGFTKRWLPAPWLEQGLSGWRDTLQNTTTFIYTPWVNYGCPWNNPYQWGVKMDIQQWGEDENGVDGAISPEMDFSNYCTV